MDEKQKAVNTKGIDPDRPKEEWDTGHCPFFIFGDDDAAEYDLNKLKKFFDKFKKKKR